MTMTPYVYMDFMGGEYWTEPDGYVALSTLLTQNPLAGAAPVIVDGNGLNGYPPLDNTASPSYMSCPIGTPYFNTLIGNLLSSGGFTYWGEWNVTTPNDIFGAYSAGSLFDFNAQGVTPIAAALSPDTTSGANAYINFNPSASSNLRSYSPGQPFQSQGGYQNTGSFPQTYCIYIPDTISTSNTTGLVYVSDFSWLGIGMSTVYPDPNVFFPTYTRKFILYSYTTDNFAGSPPGPPQPSGPSFPLVPAGGPLLPLGGSGAGSGPGYGGIIVPAPIPSIPCCMTAAPLDCECSHDTSPQITIHRPDYVIGKNAGPFG